MTKPSASRDPQPAGVPSATRRRWPAPAAAASALLLAAASPAAASDIGNFLGAVGGMLSQGMQPRYYQYQQPQYYYQQPQQYYQAPSYRRYGSSSPAARRKAQAEAEAKKKQEEADKQKKEQEAAAVTPVPTPAVADASGAVDVAMTRKSGNLWVPAKINNVVTIDFVIDSGASDITLPRDVYLTLIRSGTLTKANYIGGANFGIADGSEVKGLKFKLASLQVGNQVLNDVVASVMPSDSATPLLGLSFLSRFQSWSIDNKSGTLKLLPIGGKPAASATQTAAASVQPLPEPPDPGQPAVPGPPSGEPQTTAASQASVPAPATATPPVAIVAAAMPRSGHVATAAFVAKETTPAASAPAAAATAAAAHSSLPVFPANTAYANARSGLLALGYGPAPLPGGKCDSTTDATCFPERDACAKSDAVRCDYLWRRGDEVIKVETVAVPPTVAAVACEVNCKE